MTVHINKIEIEIPTRENVLKIGKDKFLEALVPFFTNKKDVEYGVYMITKKYIPISTIEAFYLIYQAYRKENTSKILKQIFKNFNFDKMIMVHTKDSEEIMIFDQENETIIDENTYSEIMTILNLIGGVYKDELFEDGVNYMVFNETIKALSDYENLLKNKPTTNEEEYKIECAALDVSKAFVYDLGYEEACKFARGILALGQIHDMR